MSSLKAINLHTKQGVQPSSTKISASNFISVSTPKTLDRLDQLTDNRSEFLRQCIAKAWEEQADSEETLSITLPKSLVRELRKIAAQLEPRQQRLSFRTWAARLQE